ncbi:TonB-linked SusC/RagA family outer membrane protein [Salegentibacter sp. 24]|jgi:TonB-linked SusC/RagA family outer membrane protein|uniref:SusC/RagA family TonB-linked outer membrane protein n=1 Tax=Salegentibacter sp. 24 TaxID=2183986 RepID=UPI0010EEDB24|nr:TonB-dependent receptor [Salegentibacter sp. 24]TDN95082.1 TonB-linked SusC/RagA family outer membrane protein [Salegentibacter sp. 24]
MLKILLKSEKSQKFLSAFFLMFTTFLFAQQQEITGVVSDDSGLPLPGATVLVKNTSNGTTTDMDGNFSLLVENPEDKVLVVSFISYVTQEIPINNQSSFQISLQPNQEALNEIVVVGYGGKKRATLTGSISEVEGEALAKSPQPNLSNSFAGRMSGVITTNRAGEPGYDDSSILIRGLATTGNNDVLVVVDGVPGQVGGLSRLSPENIESVTVLKDASAAIYGSRAANGVILITTKRGRNNSKPLISYKFDIGLSSPTRLPDMANAATYAQIRNEIAYYNNPDGGLNQIYDDSEIELFRSGSDPLNYPNTNWAEITLQDVAVQTQHNLNIRGGGENTNYFFSIGKTSQEGLYENGATQYDQYNLRSNIDVDISDRFNVGLSLSGRKEDRQFPTEGAGFIFRSIYRAYPTIPAFYPNGNPSTGIENANPAVLATDMGGINENPRYVFNGILSAEYELPFLEGLSVDGFFSVDELSSRIRNFRTPYILYNYNRANDVYEQITVGGGPDQQASLDEEHYNESQTVANIKLNYQNEFNGHSIDAFIGYEQSETKSHTMGASRIHFPTTQTPELSQGGPAATDRDNYGYSFNFTRQSFLSRIAYDFQEKYLAELQMRVDGSSNFPEGNRFGYFPSISAGYRITEEEWFNIDFFDDLKFRASYGRLGNDNIGQFQYYDNYSFNNSYVIGNQVVTGIDLTRLANPNITWEVAKKTDIAINASWLDHFNTELIYFKQDRTDILINRNASIPGVTGIVNPYDAQTLVPAENIGAVNSHGFEASLGYQHKSEGAFDFNLSGNFTYAENEIQFIDEASGIPDYQKQTGRPLNTYLLYRTLGIFQSEEEIENTPSVPGARPGDLIFEDLNGDGEITADDQYRTKYGNIPRITFGFTFSANYKKIDLSAVLAGQGQVRQYVLPESGTVGNFYSSWADNRWSPNNPEGTYPRVSERSSSAISGGLYRNDFWLDNNAFVRLKNIQLGYTFPEDWMERFSLSNARVYASAFNLLTFTEVEDYDPEGFSESGQFYPQQRIINLGLNVQF